MSGADLAALKLSVKAGLPDDEFVVVQGFADLAVISPDEIWLVDFKTDHVDSRELAAVVKFYEPQLKLYALALGRIYRRPVTESWLHFLSLKKSVTAGSRSSPARPGWIAGRRDSRSAKSAEQFLLAGIERLLSNDLRRRHRCEVRNPCVAENSVSGSAP